MRGTILLFSLLLTAAPQAFAQRLQVDFPGLAEKAVEVVDVTLDAQMLRLASKFFSADTADDRAVRDIVQGLQGVYVRSYQFRREGEYDRALVEGVRRQLGPNWKRIVHVASRGKDNVEVYTDVRGEMITGLVVISAEPRELTFINVVGNIDLDKLARLEGQFGIPRVTVKVEGNP